MKVTNLDTGIIIGCFHMNPPSNKKFYNHLLLDYLDLLLTNYYLFIIIVYADLN